MFFRMADNMEGLWQSFRSQNKTAFVVGYTGEVGKELVKALVTSNIFAKVTLIGRRVVTYDEEIYKNVVSFVTVGCNFAGKMSLCLLFSIVSVHTD